MADSERERKDLELLDQVLGPAADFLALCRVYGLRTPLAGAKPEDDSTAVERDMAAIASRVIGNRATFGREELRLMLAGVVRRCQEMFDEADTVLTA